MFSKLAGHRGYDSGSGPRGKKASRGRSVWSLTPDNIDLRISSVTVDYSKIEIEQAIVFTPRQFILDQCYQGDASFCNYITRRPTAVGATQSGSLEFINSGPTNSGGLFAEGIDVGVNWAKDLADWGLAGRFNARLLYTHALDGYLIPTPGADKDLYGKSVDRMTGSISGCGMTSAISASTGP